MKIKNKINLSIAAFCLSAILIVVFIIYPLFKEIRKNSQELIYQKKSLSTLEAKIKNLEGFEVLYESLEEILKKIENLFVQSELPIGFISFLETTSEDCSLKIEISPPSSKKIQKDPWPSMIFQISTTGSFPNFLKFLEKLENSPYLIEIQSLNVSRLAKNEVRTNFVIKVFAR